MTNKEIREKILKEIDDLESFEITNTKCSDSETKVANVNALVEEIKQIIKKNLRYPIEEIISTEHNKNRYGSFETFVTGPIPFNEVFKDQDINTVKVHSIISLKDEEVIMYCGVFEWRENNIISLDGDTYNEDMEVLAYKWSVDEKTKLDIIVGDDW